jgi:hypothetical protein
MYRTGRGLTHSAWLVGFKARVADCGRDPHIFAVAVVLEETSLAFSVYRIQAMNKICPILYALNGLHAAGGSQLMLQLHVCAENPSDELRTCIATKG